MVDIDDVRRIPLIGNKLYRVGQVQEIISQPCSPQPLIAVKAFFANVPMLLWSFVKPDPLDLVSDRFGRHHHRKRKGVFNIDDITIGTPTEGKGYLRWVSFTGQKVAQRVGFYFCVLDATTDFLVNWSSMAYRFSGCQDPLSGYATTNVDLGITFTAPGGWFQLGGGSPNFSSGFFASNSVVRMNSAGPHAIGAGCSYHTQGSVSPGQITGVRLVTVIGGTPDYTDIEPNQGGPGGSGSASTMVQNYGPGIAAVEYHLEVNCTPGQIAVDNWHLSLSGWPQTPPGIEPDP